MKSDNVFRFVTIRPPRKSNEAQLQIIAEQDAEEAAREFDSAVQKRVRSDNVNMEEAQRNHAKAVFASSQYFRNSREWIKWAEHKPAVMSHLINAAERGLKRYKDDTALLLKIIYAQDLDIADFVNDMRFKEMRRSIWTSFYSVAIHPEEHIDDLAEIEEWIRFASLLSSVLKESEFKRKASKLLRRRPAVPLNLLRVKFEPNIEPSATDQRIRTELAEVKILNRQIQNLKATKGVIESMVYERRCATAEHLPKNLRPGAPSPFWTETAGECIVGRFGP